MSMLIFVVFLVLFILTNEYYIPSGHSNKTLNNFAFGSCFYGRESERLDMFKIVNEHNPDLWVWLGDLAYVDTHTWHIWKQTFHINLTLAQEIFDGSKNNLCNYI